MRHRAIIDLQSAFSAGLPAITQLSTKNIPYARPLAPSHTDTVCALTCMRRIESIDF